MNACRMCAETLEPKVTAQTFSVAVVRKMVEDYGKL